MFDLIWNGEVIDTFSTRDEAEKMQAKADSIESKLSKIVLPSFHVGGSWWDSTLFSK